MVRRLFLFCTLSVAATFLFAGGQGSSRTTTGRYTGLPDPLQMQSGVIVNSPEQWFEERRPEIKELFQHYVYGYFPEVQGVRSELVNEDREVYEGLATYRELKLWISTGSGELPLPMTLALFTPNKADGPVPVFVTINRCGNHSVSPYPGITINPDMPPGGWCRGRGSHQNFWSVKMVLERGYAFATFHQSELDRDQLDPGDGIHGLLNMASESEGSMWGTIAAWAWGFSRAIDYLVTDERIDDSCISVVGHSRRGKAAILAAAFDERIALAIPHQSGTGGDALSRGVFQEPVFIMNTTFPNWFNDTFKSYNFRIDRLPVDQHMLIALVAPRTVLTIASESYWWAGYESSLRSLRAATPVYRLLGATGVQGRGLVMEGEDISTSPVGDLVQYRRAQGHRIDPEYWSVYLDFADRRFSRDNNTLQIAGNEAEK